MIVDCHVHMGLAIKPAFGTSHDYTTEDVLRNMDLSGVDMSLIMGIPHIYDNDYTLAAWKAHPDRFIPWAYVDPWHHPDPAASMRRFADQGFVGIKLRAVSLRYNIGDRYLLDPIFAAAEETGLVVSMHTGDDPSCTPLQLEQMAMAFPEVKVVLIHGGVRHLVWEAIEVAQRCPNVYIDQTAGTSWQLYRAMEILGPGRIMYGSDTPFMDTRVEQVRFRTAITDPDALAQAMGGTAMQLYGLAGAR